jgi:hypothetical protein
LIAFIKSIVGFILTSISHRAIIGNHVTTFALCHKCIILRDFIRRSATFSHLLFSISPHAPPMPPVREKNLAPLASKFCPHRLHIVDFECRQCDAPIAPTTSNDKIVRMEKE